ncbi:hypothetical protein HYW55_05380 [Candidatus Gottesmanbacteria bacterium]|nr:hypothetical protein [Candidatus Gottesmanbacteria bacterium]
MVDNQQNPLPQVSENAPQEAKIQHPRLFILILAIFLLGISLAFAGMQYVSNNTRKPTVYTIQYISVVPSYSYLPFSPQTSPLPPSPPPPSSSQITTSFISPVQLYSESVTPPLLNVFATEKQLETFRAWAQMHGITLQGVTKDINSLYYNKYDPATDHIDLEKIEYVINVFDALERIPDSVLTVMQGKTMYISTLNERPYTILNGDYLDTLKGLNEGIILTHPLGIHNTIHEFGHIVGYHGIEGIYDQNYPQFKQYASEYHRIFDMQGIQYPPATLSQGYISLYATANKAENFAEHFTYYVVLANEFREKALKDAKLLEKYTFLKEKIFAGKEY